MAGIRGGIVQGAHRCAAYATPSPCVARYAPVEYHAARSARATIRRPAVRRREGFEIPDPKEPCRDSDLAEPNLLTISFQSTAASSRCADARLVRCARSRCRPTCRYRLRRAGHSPGLRRSRSCMKPRRRRRARDRITGPARIRAQGRPAQRALLMRRRHCRRHRDMRRGRQPHCNGWCERTRRALPGAAWRFRRSPMRQLADGRRTAGGTADRLVGPAWRLAWWSWVASAVRRLERLLRRQRPATKAEALRRGGYRRLALRG